MWNLRGEQDNGVRGGEKWGTTGLGGLHAGYGAPSHYWGIQVLNEKIKNNHDTQTPVWDRFPSLFTAFYVCLETQMAEELNALCLLVCKTGE